MAILKDLIVNGNSRFVGTPLAPTAATGTNTTQVATTAFVQGAVTSVEDKLNVFFSGSIDSESTATVMTATVPGVTELKNGICAYITNDVINSASGFTIDVNDLGAKPVYSNQSAADRLTTGYAKGTTFLFVYNESRVEGGCWDAYYGMDTNDTAQAYQLHTRFSTLPLSDVVYRYRLLFTSADGTHFVPANTSSSTNATAIRAVNQRPIDPFGKIVCYNATAALQEGTTPSTSVIWDQFNVTLGYSFNNTGAALTLTPSAPVYLKCTPQNNGSAIIDATTPYVQALPSTADGCIYIQLGIASGATTVELFINHPVYYYLDGVIKQWSGDINEVSHIVAYEDTDVQFRDVVAESVNAQEFDGQYVSGDNVIVKDSNTQTSSQSGHTHAKIVFTANGQDQNDYEEFQLPEEGGTIALTSQVQNKVIGDGITKIKSLTQAQYDALATKDSQTFYVIV